MWRENWNKVYVKKTMIISIVIQQLSSINYYMSSPSLYICIQIYIQWQERNVCIIVNIIFDQICFLFSIFYILENISINMIIKCSCFPLQTRRKEKLKIMRHSWDDFGPS